MKHFLSSIIVLLCISGATYAQNNKLAHINFEELFEIMPQKDSAENVFNKEYKEALSMIEEMQNDLAAKARRAEAGFDTLSENSKMRLQEQLMGENQRIQEFQSQQEKNLMKRRESLLSPIIKQAQDAINAVAKKEGFLYVFDVSEGSQVLYFSESSTDLLPLVKKYLGIVN